MKNSKDITIYDIAKELQISAATVSRGLNDHPAIKKQTREKIHETARRMGYQQNIFASNLRKQKTNTIGVIVPHLNSYFTSTVIAGIEKIANQSGYNLIISQSLESVRKERSNVDTMFNSRVDGLLVSLASDTEDIEHFQFILQKEIPLIFYDRVIEAPNCTCITIDNFQAGYSATQHLLEQGCRRVVHVAGNLRSSVYEGRHSGYKQALQDFGLDYDPSLVLFPDLRDVNPGNTAQDILAMDTLPDGLFCVSDTQAAAIISELQRADIKVPQQIAVVGFNNDLLSRVVEPALSTIHYPGQEMGEIAARTLIRQLNNESQDEQNTIVIKHHLIKRASSLRE
ncbi:LacI family DNA-binding transcriptional regulator [Tunicatimonas pelagia]|uniref:LacI family DNA-binding transcriptional regulator n=1 Tax=Tunicatimonas pelagia TaxID=931531 RepID=UPI0026667235|nr:LacI family DNA-binding transcriptional regulator [Tunicatimonas pelagia]WKN42581.1 LacI family DNA-binding transcriptional regulator [Tunicatimonas pelagia]